MTGHLARKATQWLGIICFSLALYLTMDAQASADAANGPYCRSGKTVTFAGLNWESGEFLTAIMRELLERGYGCKTESVPGNTVTLEQALGNNDIQIIAEEWVSRSDTWKKAADAGKVRGVGHPFTGATEGWYVPDYMKMTAPQLNDVSQLSEAKYKLLFRDPEQPSKGRFLNCPSGWTCEGVNTAKLQAYGLDTHYVDFRPGTGPAMDAAIVSAYGQKQPLLFYYWSPSAIAGKLKLTKLREPAYSDACWKALTSKTARHSQGCAAPEADIAWGVSSSFSGQAPEIVDLLKNATVPLAMLNANLVAIADDHANPRDQAVAFLKLHPEVWHTWLDQQTAARIDASLGVTKEQSKTAFPQGLTVSIRQPVNEAVDQLVKQHGGAFRAVSSTMLSVILAVDGLLGSVPWWLLVAIFMGLAWLGSRRLSLTAIVGLLMFAIGMLGLWDLMVQTLSLMLISSGLGVLLGVPAGIGAAKSPSLKAVLMPLLDVMQTMPGFVYLIPALMLFGLGKVPAVLATVIFCLPPMIRMTALGIEQVDRDVREAGEAFGLTPLQLLLQVELPLARPSLLAGLNQMIMLALSMVVVASMIGARGLGEQVLNGIQTLDVGQGLEAGIGIVILAFVLDRVTQGFGQYAGRR
jgi:glycine betaine/proline transport system substrate-binding protein